MRTKVEIKQGHYFCKVCGSITEDNWVTKSFPSNFTCDLAMFRGYTPEICPICTNKSGGFSGEFLFNMEVN